MFLAALAALYLTLVSQSVSNCHFRILTQRVTFETSDQENNDNKDNDNEDNDNEDYNDEYRGPNCDVRAVSQFCDVFL